MKRKIFYGQWVREGNSWMLLIGKGKAIGVILIVDEAEHYPVFQLDKGRVEECTCR